MIQKTESILIRVSKELSDNIDYWIQKTGKKKSSLIREAIRSHLKQLERDDPEVKEVIRAIIISKLDKIQKEYDQGRIVVFQKVIPFNTLLNCSLCRDENEVEYIVYDIIQYTDETRIEAINRHAQVLYDEWRRLPDEAQNSFMNDLHQEHVYFSMKPRSI
jgi:predicted DNA-binding protein